LAYYLYEIGIGQDLRLTIADQRLDYSLVHRRCPWMIARCLGRYATAWGAEYSRRAAESQRRARRSGASQTSPRAVARLRALWQRLVRRRPAV
jgi:hypothetical protein